MAGFTLNLGFGGLCLYVPERDGAGPERMHVLLPPCWHGDPHLPVLVYDMAARSGTGATGVPLVEELDGYEIDLSELADATLTPPPDGVPDLTRLFGARIPRELLHGDAPGSRVAARVRFAAGSSRIAPGGEGAWWTFPESEVVRLAIRVIWSIRVDAAELTVRLRAIDGSSASREVTLYPSGDSLDLWVFNSPASQIPTTLPPLTSCQVPDPGDPADHFASLYGLTDARERPLPRFHHADAFEPAEYFELIGLPGLDLFCIAAQALPVG